MKHSALKRLEYRDPVFTTLITFVVALIALTTTSGSAFSSSGAKTLEPQTTAQESKQTDVRELKVGAPIERELAAGDTHSYRVMLTTGQYFHLIVEQKGIDVVVRLFGPERKKIAQVDNDPTVGSESVIVIAEASGEYRVDVQPSSSEAKTGRYEIKIDELRNGTPKDRIHADAERVVEEGIQLRDQQTAESRQKAIKKYEEALPLWRDVGDKKGEAFTLNQIGVLYSRTGQPKKALEYYDKAIPLWHVVGDLLNEATTLTNMGIAYGRLGEVRKALEFHRQALPLARSAGDPEVEALTLSNIGSAYWSLGEPQEALRYYEQALPLTLDDRRQLAVTLNNIAMAYTQLGELQKATEYLSKSLPLRRLAKDRQGEATVLHNLGLIYRELGDLQMALKYYNQALEIRRAVGDRQGQAVTLQSLSTVYTQLGDLEQALKWADQALAMTRAVGDRHTEAYELSAIGKIQELSGEPRKALDTFEQALSLRRALGDRYGEAYSFSDMGNSYLALGNLEKALEYYRQSLTLHRDIGDKLGEVATLYGMTRAQSKLGDNLEALAQIRAAIDIIESTRGKFISQQLRTSFSASRQDHYQLFIDLLMRMHGIQPASEYDAAALQASERARARSLLELLAEARIDVKQGIAPSLKQHETDIQNRISWVQSQLRQANSQPKPDRSKIDVLEEEFKKVEDQREQVETEIRQQHPRYATLHYPTPLGLKAIQGILDEKTVLLEYSLGKEASFLFVISKNDFLTAQLPAASLLANQVTTLREAVATGPDRMALSNYLQKARSLYQELVEPANRLLSGKQALIIVPDGILHYLPFEVLLESDSGRKAQVDLHQLPYLIRNYAISYTPSATVLANLHNRDRTTQTPGKAFLAYGDPDYGKTESEQTAEVRSAVRSAFGEGKPWELQQLPQSRLEVERIAKLFHPEQVSILLGEQATEENVKLADRLSQYRFVHFAVHGLLNESKPQYSGLVLSLPRSQSEKTAAQEAISIPTTTLTNAVNVKDNASRVEDGLLQVYEIFNLKLNADLVVLSACETGLGKDVKGEGLVGLTQAFLYAGTPSLAVSLWKVQDKSTAELMVRFYRHLNDPTLSKAEALRQAQLEMIRKGDFSHPYYWAGFVLLGQP